MTQLIIEQIELPENETPPATPTSNEEVSLTDTNGKLARLRDANEAYQIVAEILIITHELASLSDLKPCSRVNDLFGRLVSLCIKPWSAKVGEEVLGDKKLKAVVKRLREMCAEGEGELEKHWAQIFLQELETQQNTTIDGTAHKSVARNILKSFPYYQNYVDLCNLELSNILATLSQYPSQSSPIPISTDTPLSIAFIGSGPIPFTSFMFANNLPNANITNIDISLPAIHVSSQLASQLGFNKMYFLHEDATNLNSLAEFDIAFLAALVGMSSHEKTKILQNVCGRMRNGALLCVRSAVGLRSLLYPVIEFDEEVKACGLEMVLEVRPWNHIVNSTLIMRVERRRNL